MKKASLLLLEKNGKYLFARRAKTKKSLPNKWSLPSETIEIKETKEKTAWRCLKHELKGIQVNNLELFETFHFKKEGKEKILYFFKASYTGTAKIKANEELTELKEYTLDEFFKKYSNEEIGHGLQYLREKWKE